ncbi:MAG: TRAP transporter small permease subunit [Rhodocyclaceae bacterium]
MDFLLRTSKLIDALSQRIGAMTLWLVLAAVLISGGNAIVRKLFQTSSNALLELQWYLFSAVFLLGAGYAFLKNAHVRIDFVASRFSPRLRATIDIIGILVFLLPFCYLIFAQSWTLFVKAWESGEMSQNAGGLIRWPAYLLMPLGMALLGLQAFSELIKRIAFLRGSIPDPTAHAHGAASELEEWAEELAEIEKAPGAGK